MDYSFSKNERIYKKDEIDRFFKSGQHFVVYPFRVMHYSNTSSIDTSKESLKIIISIPKKLIKRAVNRNLLKRRTKEAYRLNRNSLKTDLLANNNSISVFLIYTSSECSDFAVIENKIILILQRLQAIYAKNSK